MLIEPSRAIRYDAGYRRRWFTDEEFDLYVWLDEDDDLTRLQLCYDKQGDQRVLSWSREHGFRHDRIDDGEGVAGKARTPVFVIDGYCDIEALRANFRAAGGAMSGELFDRVYARLLAFTPPR